MCSLKKAGKCKMAGNGYCRTYCRGCKEERYEEDKKKAANAKR